MKKWKRGLYSVVLSLLLLLGSIPQNVYAANEYQSGQSGSITVRLKDIGTDKNGAGFALYQIGEVAGGINITYRLTESTAGSDGTITFPSLEHGVYLVYQTAEAGYGVVDPFLVFLPYTNLDGDGWIYDVTASPKAERTTLDAELLKVDESGNPVAGAQLALYDAAGNKLDEWISGNSEDGNHQSFTSAG